jgi:starch-binding outer membrane protein, SusD/RagB family
MDTGVKMKKILQATGIFAIMVTFFSCSEDFTMLAPISERNVDNFYQTESDFNTAILGVYNELQNGGTYGTTSGLATGGSGGYWIMSEMRSDNTDQGADVTGLAAAIAEINTFNETPLNEYILGAWVGSYKGIANANTVISRIDDSELNETFKKQIKGEALFLRSLFYYNLALLFGNIPMPLEELKVSNPDLPQKNQTEVLEQLSSDLSAAAELLSESGAPIRASKYAALTLLGRIHLHLGNDSEAAAALRDVINSGRFTLVDDYVNLWGPENENNSESIFEVQFLSGGIGEGSGYTNSFSPDNELQTGEGFGRNRPTIDMVNAYEPGDLRFTASMDTVFTIDTVVTYERHVKKYWSDPFANYDADNNFIVFRYADVLLMMAEALGENDEAYSYINEVRSRAGLANISAGTAGTFEEKLLKERRVELAFENHRWYDLLRFGKAIEQMNAHFAREGIGKVISEDDLLFPIPQREVDLGLSQNP